jgi:hypothetical protein
MKLRPAGRSAITAGRHPCAVAIVRVCVITEGSRPVLRPPDQSLISFAPRTTVQDWGIGPQATSASGSVKLVEDRAASAFRAWALRMRRVRPTVC